MGIAARQRLDVNHHDLILEPLPQIIRINNFLVGGLDIEGMQKAIDPNLYWQRTSSPT